MSTNTIVGLVLIFAGFLDCVIGAFVVAPKIQEPVQRKVVLGTVISKLSSAATGGVAGPGSGIHVPYRDSKLTRVLQPALGGNSKTAIICAMTPAAKHCDESHNSLMFACRAKTIVNEVRVGVDGGDGDAGAGAGRLDEEAVKRLVKRKVESMTSFMLFGG